MTSILDPRSSSLQGTSEDLRALGKADRGRAQVQNRTSRQPCRWCTRFVLLPPVRVHLSGSQKPIHIVESADPQCVGRSRKTACIGPGHDGVATRPLASDDRKSQPFSQLQRPSSSMLDAELRLPSTRVTPSCFTPFHLTLLLLLLLLAGKLLFLLPLLARTLPALSLLSHPSHPSHNISCVPSTSYMHPLITTACLVLSDYFGILVPRRPLLSIQAPPSPLLCLICHSSSIAYYAPSTTAPWLARQ